MLRVVFCLIFLFIGVVVCGCKRNCDPEEKKHGLFDGSYHIIGLLVALKVKLIFVLLAVWGGVMLAGKVFFAGLWPIIHMMTYKHQGLKDYHHYHGTEYAAPIYIKPDHDFEEEEEEEVKPPYHYGKPWNRRNRKPLYRRPTVPPKTKVV